MRVAGIFCALVFVSICFSQEQASDSISPEGAPVLKKANAGDAASQNKLGIMYMSGDEVPKDKEKAVEWYRKAAKQGSAAAAFNLGAAYYNGDGVAISDPMALAWFEIAQNGGNAAASDAVTRSKSSIPPGQIAAAEIAAGDAYEDGTEVPQDYPLARHEYEEAEPLTPMADLKLGQMYRRALGVARDLNEASTWCKKGADRKLPVAMYCMGQIAQSQNPPDYKAALDWYQRGAEFGNADCFHNIGAYYAAGVGTEKNLVTAYSFFLLARDFSDPNASQGLEAIGPQLSDADKKHAQEIEIKWWAKNHNSKILPPLLVDRSPNNSGPPK